MDNGLHKLLHLYDEVLPESADGASPPLSDEELDAMRSMKQVLDGRDRKRPPESTIDAVVAAAGSAAQASRRIRDRQPVHGRRRVVLPIGIASSCALVVAVVIVLTQPYASDRLPDLVSNGHAEVPVPPGSASTPDDVGRALPEARGLVDEPRFGRAELTGRVAEREDGRPIREAEPSHSTAQRHHDVTQEPALLSASAVLGGKVDTAVALLWDDSEDVRSLYREVLQLELVSPSSGHWRPVVPDPLAAPVGISPSYRLTRLDGN